MTERENTLKTDEQTQPGLLGAIAGQIISTTTSGVKSALGTLAGQVAAQAVSDKHPHGNKSQTAAMAHSADTLNISERAQNSDEARSKGQARLDSKNDYKHTGSLSMAGDLSLRAGVSITLSGFGQADGKWLITRARHAFTRSGGLTTELEIARGLKPKKTTAKPTTALTVFKADGTTEQVKKDKRIPVR